MALGRVAVLVGILALGGAIGGGCSRERVDLSRWVLLLPSQAILKLPARRTELSVVVRNVSPVVLTSLRLEAHSECCVVRILSQPRASLIPGDRARFTLSVERREGLSPARYPLALTLYGAELPVPAGLDLMVDLNRGTGQDWLDVGEVKLVARDDSRLWYYVLAGGPLLILVGWSLYRVGRKRAGRSSQ